MKNKKHCHFCQVKQAKSWIEEKHYQGNHGQTLKEVNIGCKSEEKREPINIIYYCSINCMERQMDQEEEELWKKGKCKKCGVHLAVINDRCHDLTHKKEACLLAFATPDCLQE